MDLELLSWIFEQGNGRIAKFNRESKKLRNYTEGIEYLERVLYHKDCPPDIAISAGKSLASAYVALGEKQTATAYMNLVIDFAKSMKISQEYVQLEAQLKEINSL